MKRIVLLLTSVCLLLVGVSTQAQIAECNIDNDLGQNLIVNGDFEQGNVGFTSDLALFAGGGSAEFYYVGSNPKTFNAAFNGSDHTTGSGKMLMLDASNDLTKTRMWFQLVEVKPNTNYFFTAHIANILGPTSQIIPQLVFKVNGQVLKDTIDAPLNTSVWNSFTSEWYSGANPPQFVTISIENIKTGGTGEGGGNDMALDDISFIEGCGFGGLGEEPDLGPSIQTICGTTDGKLTITAAATSGVTYEYKWSTNNAKDTLKSLVVTQPGTYALCMTTNGSCPRVNKVVVSDDFSVSLGNDVALCSPATTTLVPDYLKGAKYDWLKDNVSLGQFRNQKSATVNEVGTYKLVVTDANASCGTREDEVIVTSKTIQAVNGTFCPGDGAVNLSIKNMTNAATNYKWYSDAALTTPVATGGTFSTPSNLTQTTTYWVKDESVQKLTAGIPISKYAAGYGSTGDFDKYIQFTVKNDFVLDSITIYPLFYNAGSGSYGLKILDVDNALSLVKQAEATYTATGATNNNTRNTPFKIFVGQKLLKGKTYQIRKVAGGNAWLSSTGWTETNNAHPDILTISTSENWLTLGFYDWNITAGSPCDPIEVKAIYDPIKCVTCLSPTDVTIAVTGTQPLKCTTDQVTLTANVNGGSGTWNYAWTKDGQVVGANSNTITVSKADAGTYQVGVADQTNPLDCFAASTAQAVTTSTVAQGSVSLNAALSQAQCLVGNVTATATVQNITNPVYEWLIGSVVQSSTIETASLSLNDGDVVTVNVTGTDECGATTTAMATATVIGETEITPSVSITGVSGLCDSEDANITTTVTPSNLTNVSYAWTISPGGATSTDPTYIVRLADGDKVDVVVTFGGSECLTTTTASISATADVVSSFTPSITINGPTASVCEQNLPVTYTVGTGVISGTTTFEWFKNGTESVGTGTALEISDIEDGDEITVVATTDASCATQPTATSSPLTLSLLSSIDASVSVSGFVLQCEGKDIDLTADVTPNGTAGTYKWMLNGVETGDVGTTYSSKTLERGNQITVEFTPNAPCLVNPVVTSTPLTIDFDNPSVSIGLLQSQGLCSGKDNGVEVKNPLLDGETYEWTLNEDPTVISTQLSVERSDFKTGDVVRLKMTPDPLDNCPTAKDSVILGEFANQEFINVSLSDSVLCEGSVLRISAFTQAGGLAPKFTWFKNEVEMIGETASSISVSGAEGDEYKVVFESSLYCVDDTIASDSIILHIVPQPVANAGADIALKTFEEVKLNGEGSSLGDFNYRWTSNDTTLYDVMTGRLTLTPSVKTKEKLTTFYLNVSTEEEGKICSANDSMQVSVNFTFKIPSAFSPNGDGTNELFRIKYLDQLDSFKFMVYNRWGSLLWEQSNPNDFWDGTNNGNPLPAGTYFYTFTYKLDGETKSESNYITLIR